MNAAVNTAVMMSIRKSEATDKRKKTKEGEENSFQGLMALKTVGRPLIVEDTKTGEVSGKELLSGALEAMAEEKTSTFSTGEKWCLYPEGEPSGLWTEARAFLTAGEQPVTEGGQGVIPQSGFLSLKDAGLIKESGFLKNTGSTEEGRGTLRQEEEVVRNSPGITISPRAEGLGDSGNSAKEALLQQRDSFAAEKKTGDQTCTHVTEEEKPDNRDGAVAVATLRDAYQVGTEGNTVKIKVAEPYNQLKPEFAKDVSEAIQSRLLGKGETLEIELQPEQLGTIRIKLKAGQEGTRLEMHCTNPRTALLLEKNMAEIGRLVQYHTETPVNIDIRQEEAAQYAWNQQQGHQGGRNPEEEKKKQGSGGNHQEAADFIEKLRLGLEKL